MAKYFEVTVTVQHEVDGGKGGTKIKKVRESYLVDAMTVTEAEARVVGEFEKAGIKNINDFNKKPPVQQQPTTQMPAVNTRVTDIKQSVIFILCDESNCNRCHPAAQSNCTLWCFIT